MTTAVQPRRCVDPLAVASLAFLWLLGVGSLLGVVLGLAALSRTRRTGDGGRGIAAAGVALGAVGLGTLLLLFVLGTPRGAEVTHTCRDVVTGSPC